MIARRQFKMNQSNNKKQKENEKIEKEGKEDRKFVEKRVCREEAHQMEKRRWDKLALSAKRQLKELHHLSSDLSGICRISLLEFSTISIFMYIVHFVMIFFFVEMFEG